MKKLLSLVFCSSLFTGVIIAQTQYYSSGDHQFNTTNYGYMRMGTGPISDYYFYTDKSYYRFDKPIRSTNSFLSYNSTLNLEAASGHYVQIQPRSSSYGLILREYNSSDYGNIEVTSSGLGLGYNTSGYNMLIKTDGNIYFNNNVEMRTSWWFGFGTRAEGFNRLQLHHNGTHGYIDYKDNLHFRADKNWNSALTLYGDGSVGVGFGTTYTAGQYLTQGYKFAVNGKILCEGVKCITDVPNSDFVFENDYKLMDLHEVEKFVKENKHLPEVPSSEDFKQNGYNMGEFDDIMLRKVEQLTLYIIEQNKKIAELQEQLNSLEK